MRRRLARSIILANLLGAVFAIPQCQVMLLAQRPVHERGYPACRSNDLIEFACGTAVYTTTHVRISASDGPGRG